MAETLALAPMRRLEPVRLPFNPGHRSATLELKVGADLAARIDVAAKATGLGKSTLLRTLISAGLDDLFAAEAA